MLTCTFRLLDREDALRDDFHFESNNLDLDEDEADWNEEEPNWNDDDDGPADLNNPKSENSAYLEFLHEEVGPSPFPFLGTCTDEIQAQKFGAGNTEEEDELGEDGVMLESPLDKIDAYQIFNACLLSASSFVLLGPTSGERATANTRPSEMQQENPAYYTSLTSHLTPDEMATIQTVMDQARAQIVHAAACCSTTTTSSGDSRDCVFWSGP